MTDSVWICASALEHLTKVLCRILAKVYIPELHLPEKRKSDTPCVGLCRHRSLDPFAQREDKSFPTKIMVGQQLSREAAPFVAAAAVAAAGHHRNRRSRADSRDSGNSARDSRDTARDQTPREQGKLDTLPPLSHFRRQRSVAESAHDASPPSLSL